MYVRLVVDASFCAGVLVSAAASVDAGLAAAVSAIAYGSPSAAYCCCATDGPAPRKSKSESKHPGLE